jgi:hypothetical protein
MGPCLAPRILVPDPEVPKPMPSNAALPSIQKGRAPPRQPVPGGPGDGATLVACRDASAAYNRIPGHQTAIREQRREP